MNILPFLESVFAWLLAASWQASVLALVVLGLQQLLGTRLNPRWRYALWLLVLARLLLPALPESALSLFQFAPPAPAALVEPVTQPLFPVATSLPTLPATTDATSAPEPTHRLSVYSILAVLWLVGAMTLLALTWLVNLKFLRQIEAAPEIADPELRQLFATTKAELAITRSIRLIESAQVQSPAIMGLFRPTLLLPARVREQFDPAELRLIFLHELAHLKRGDVLVQGLIALLQILHWFNPVLWYAFRRMRIDREPATDALVLSRAGEEEKERYGLMLIKLLEHFNQRHSLPTLVGILEDKDQFRRRFSLIARFTSGAYGWSLLGALLIGLLPVFCLTQKVSNAATDDKPLPVKPWNGWGPTAPPNPDPTSAAPVTPEQFELVKNAPGAPQVFSGKVEVPGSLEGVEIGLVSLVGIHWINPEAYQWQPVKSDGTFSITQKNYPESRKALVVRGPHFPWTFLRYDFLRDESASAIVLKVPVPKKVRLTARDAKGDPLSHVGYEMFPAYAPLDDHGTQLRRQRMGTYKTDDANFIEVELPVGQIALFVHHKGLASNYQIIDTRKADQFDFAMRPAGQMRFRVLDADGKPLPGVKVEWVNPAAPLSLYRSDTGADGVVVGKNLVPGSFQLTNPEFRCPEIKVLEGQETEILLQDGKPGEVSEPKPIPAPSPKSGQIQPPTPPVAGTAAAPPPLIRNELDLTGIVTDQMTGAPIPEARVVFSLMYAREKPLPDWPPETPAQEEAHDDYRKTGMGDEAGKFTIKDVSHRRLFTLIATAPGYGPEVVQRFDPASGPARFTLSRLDPPNTPGGKACGHLTDPEGKPIAGAKVETSCYINNSGFFYTSVPPENHFTFKTSDYITTTNAEGNFTLPFEKGYQGIKVDITAPGFAPQNFPFIMYNDRLTPLTLNRGVTVTGRLVKDGQPVPNVQVGISQVDKGDGFTGEIKATTDADGRFALKNVVAGTMAEVHGKRDSLGALGVTTSHRVQLGAADSSTEVGDIEVLPGRKLTGQLTFADGQIFPTGKQLVQLHVNREDGSYDPQYINLDAKDLKFEVWGRDGDELSMYASIRGFKQKVQTETPENRGMDTFLVGPDSKPIQLIFEPLPPKAEDPAAKGMGFTFTGVGVAGQVEVTDKSQIDFTKSKGVLWAKDGKKLEFTFKEGGTYQIPMVPFGIYHPTLTLFLRPEKLTYGKGGATEIPQKPLELPSPSETGKNPKMGEVVTVNFSGEVATPEPMVRLELRLAEIREEAYLKNRKKVDVAVKAGDVATLVQMKGIDLLSAPMVTSHFDQNVNIDVVREFRYPTSYTQAKSVPLPSGQKDKGGEVVQFPATPKDFATRDVGISAVLKATESEGRVLLDGKLLVTMFEGFIESNVTGVKMPTFSTRESLFLESLESDKPKALWIPGAQFDEETITDKLPSGKTVTSTKTVKKRFLLIVTAHAVEKEN